MKPTLALAAPAPAGLSGKWYATSYTNSDPFGTVGMTAAPGNTLTPYMFQAPKGTNLDLPMIEGARVLVCVSWRGGTSAVYARTIGAGNKCTFLVAWNAQSNNVDDNPAPGETCSRCGMCFLMDIGTGLDAGASATRPYIPLSGLTLPSGASLSVEVDMVVVPSDYGV